MKRASPSLRLLCSNLYPILHTTRMNAPRRVVIRASRPSLIDLRFKGDPWVVDNGSTASVCLGDYPMAQIAACSFDVPTLNRALAQVRLGQARRNYLRPRAQARRELNDPSHPPNPPILLKSPLRPALRAGLNPSAAIQRKFVGFHGYMTVAWPNKRLSVSGVGPAGRARCHDRHLIFPRRLFLLHSTQSIPLQVTFRGVYPCGFKTEKLCGR